MKKILFLFLSILLLTLAGCTKPPAEVTVPTTHASASATDPTNPPALPVPMDMPLLSISAPTVTETHTAADGTTIFTYTYPAVSMTLEDPQIADAVIIDLLNLLDFENSAAKSILHDAKAAYAQQGNWIPYSFSVALTPERFDRSILSFYGTQHISSDSHRTASTGFSVTYDLLSGRHLTLTDIFEKDFSADTLSQLISDSLQSLAEKGMLFSDYAYVISELFTTNKPSGNWFFSENGLCFYFAPYEIAPYSTGTVITEVPYTSLTGILRDDYFPAEQTESSGTFHALPLSGTDLTAFTEFSELILDEAGDKYLFYPNGVLQNVRISTGIRQDDGSFLADHTIFAAAALYSGDAVMIQLPADPSYGLCITYQANGQRVSTDLLSLIS